MALFDSKKYEHKKKADRGAAFGKSFNYEYGRNKAKTIAMGAKSNKVRTKALDKAQSDPWSAARKNPAFGPTVGGKFSTHSPKEIIINKIHQEKKKK